MTLLDAGGKITSLLIDLVKWREAQRDKRYKLVVPPVFATMQTVHQDLLDMLRATRESLVTSQSFSHAFEEFDRNRHAHQGLRHEMHHRCGYLLADPNLKDCHEFLRSVDRYFGEGPFRVLRVSERTELRLVRHAARREPNVPAAVAELDMEIRQLKEAWLKIADSHAAALAASL